MHWVLGWTKQTCHAGIQNQNYFTPWTTRLKKAIWALIYWKEKNNGWWWEIEI